MKFTASTYRAARRRARAAWIEAHDLITWAARRDDALGIAEGVREWDRASSLALRIVARARREKGLWK